MARLWGGISRGGIFCIATCFGVGCLRPAPGTWGSLAAVGVCGLIEFLGGGVWILFGVALGSFMVGVPVSAMYGDRVGRSDHPSIVIDEFSAQSFVLCFVPFGWISYGLGFCLFRFFDIVKVFPAGWIDRHWKGGWGVMVDDLVAGIWAVFVILGLEALFLLWFIYG